MEQHYQIEGMTCNGCRADVESKLNGIKGVTASVNLEKKEAIITMKSPLPLTDLQRALLSKYTISKKKHETATFDQIEEKSELRQLFPLFLIFGYITIAAVLLNFSDRNLGSFMLDFMGLFYVVFSFFKLLDLKGFPASFKMYDPLAKRLPVYGWIYPFIEITLGLLFLMRIQIGLALVSTIIILGITTIGVTKVLLDKKSVQCACLGTALKLPMTKATFIENSVMLVMAVIMLWKIWFN